MIVEVDATGPMGDQRRLRIEVTKGTIEVHNLLAREDTLCVRRPVYGYEPYLAAEIERLTVERDKWKHVAFENMPSAD